MSEIDPQRNPPGDVPPQSGAAGPTPEGAGVNARAPEAAPAPAAKRKKKRWWLRILLTLLILIFLLVAFAPYIASTAPVRSIVVNQINNNLNGSVAIANYSVGWTGGIRADGVKVFDANKNVVLEVPRVSTRLSLIDAIRGNLDLGDTQIDVRLNDVQIDKDGKLNLASLAKEQPKKEPTERAKQPPTTKPIDVPNIRGKLTVNILGGKVSGDALPAPVLIDPGTIVVNIPDINQPIQNDVKLAYHVEGSQPSAIGANGSVDAVENGKVDTEKLKETLKATQKVTLSNVDLAAAAPFLKLGPDAVVKGLANGSLDIATQGFFGVNAGGQIAVTNAEFSGAGVKDHLVLDRISIPVQVATSGADPSTMLIKIEKLAIETPLANVNVAGQVPQQALEKLGKKQPPGAEGQVNLSVVVPDLAKVANALPKTLDLAKGVAVTGGSFTTSTAINITKEGVNAIEKLDLAAQGTRDNKPIELKPVHMETSAVALMTGKEMPDLRDLKLLLNSAFAMINGGGPTVGNLTVNGNFDLNKLRNELVQFSDLGGLELAGTGDFTVKTDGDPTAENAPIKGAINANLNGVRVAGATSQPVDVSRVALNAGATVTRSAGKPTAVQDGSLTLQAGDANAPLINVAATGSYDMNKQSAAFDLSKCEINNLADVQKQYGGLAPALAQQNITLNSGAVYVNVGGTYDGATKTLVLTKPLGLSMPNLVVMKDGRQVFGREDITARLAGEVQLAPDATKAKLTDLNFGAKSNLFAVNKSGDAPIDVTLAKNGIMGNGAIALAADIKRLSDIAQNFGGQVTVKDQAGQIKSGKFDGVLQLAHGNDKKTNITFDGGLTNLTITTNEKPLENETMKIAAKASSPDDFSAVNVETAGIESKFATAKVNDAIVKLGGGAFEMVQQASVDVDVPNLPALYTLMNALKPPAAAGSATPQAAVPAKSAPMFLLSQAEPRGDERISTPKKPRKPKPDENPPENTTAPPLEPLQLTSGSATMKLNVKRDAAKNATDVNLTDCRISNLALARGEKRYAFKNDINLKLAAAATSTGQELQSLTVNDLGGDLGGVAKLAMPEPIKVTGPMDKPAANGAVKLDGTLDALVPLLAVLNGGEELPYRGDYSLTQKIGSSQTSEGLAVNLDGSFSAPRFIVLGDGGKPAFEDQIEEKNSIGLYLDKKIATIRSLTVNMPKSNALGVNVTGRVIDWAQNRTLKDVKLDLAYDLGQLWKVIFPMMSPEMREKYKDLKIAGKAQRTFNVSGAYPNKPTMGESIRSLSADGGLAIEMLDLPQGLTIQAMDFPFKMKQGVIETLAGKVGAQPPMPEDTRDGQQASRSKPRSGSTGGRPSADPTKLRPENAWCNGGALNLAGISIDMTSSAGPLVSTPKNKKLLQDIRLNPVLADSLGKTGAILFVGSDNAEGLVNLRVVECNRVPVSEILGGGTKSRATIVLNVSNLQVTGIIPNVLATVADLGSEGIQGGIPDSTITLANGQATTDLTVLINKAVQDKKTGREKLQGQPIKFTGGVGLERLDLRDFKVEVSPELLIRDLRKIAPNGATLPLTGFASKPNIDVQKFIAENAVKGFIPGADGKSGDNPLGGLGDLLGGNKDKDKKKK